MTLFQPHQPYPTPIKFYDVPREEEDDDEDRKICQKERFEIFSAFQGQIKMAAIREQDTMNFEDWIKYHDMIDIFLNEGFVEILCYRITTPVSDLLLC